MRLRAGIASATPKHVGGWQDLPPTTPTPQGPDEHEAETAPSSGGANGQASPSGTQATETTGQGNAGSPDAAGQPPGTGPTATLSGSADVAPKTEASNGGALAP